MASTPQLSHQNAMSALEALGVVVPQHVVQPGNTVVPHVAQEGTMAPHSMGQIVPVDPAGALDVSFDFSQELGKVIDDHDKLQQYESNLRSEYQARCLQLESQAEQLVVNRTALVVKDAAQKVDHQRAGLHEEWLQAMAASLPGQHRGC